MAAAGGGTDPKGTYPPGLRAYCIHCCAGWDPLLAAAEAELLESGSWLEVRCRGRLQQLASGSRACGELGETRPSGILMGTGATMNGSYRGGEATSSRSICSSQSNSSSVEPAWTSRGMPYAGDGCCSTTSATASSSQAHSSAVEAAWLSGEMPCSDDGC
eukprot:scaffold7308_cov114-Isochrysis_galbana.AAC.11